MKVAIILNIIGFLGKVTKGLVQGLEDLDITVVVGWLVGFYGISTYVGYLMPDPFLFKLSVLFQTIYLSMSTQFVKKLFYFKLFSLVKQF